ncbi:MAG: glycosyl hydrolase family 28-related protein [Paracoccaceae bacterium]
MVATGSVVRIESVQINDVTSYFHRKLMHWVDVRDYGAIGDGITDDIDAFLAADAAAKASGQELLISAGTYYLSINCTLNARCRFEEALVMPTDKRLMLTHNLDLPTYVDAFGNDTLAFNTALQALFNYTDHESLDMCGMRIQLDAPVDVQAAVGNKDTFANRRVLRNGQLEVNAGSAWNTEVFSSTASYSSGDDLMLTNVANIASIPVGSLVTGTGAGLAGGCFDELEC